MGTYSSIFVHTIFLVPCPIFAGAMTHFSVLLRNGVYISHKTVLKSCRPPTTPQTQTIPPLCAIYPSFHFNMSISG